MRTQAALAVLAVSLGCLPCPAEIPIVLAPEAGRTEQLAAEDLAQILARIHPQETFTRSTRLNATGPAILVGMAKQELVRTRLGDSTPTAPESYVVCTLHEGGRELGVIAGADARGTAYGVYGLLEKLGCGLQLSGDAVPAPTQAAFSFAKWGLTNQPLTGTRLVFNWHNFLSGCSTWNLADWKRWTAQSQKLGYNAIMVHAYGNNPMAGYDFEGVPKPVGYLSTTIKGRDWSTMHVNDVRRLFGGSVFAAPVFGAEAGLVPDQDRVAAAQALMQGVFADAAERSMGVYFAVDVDTPSANPQELVLRLPESARFPVKAGSSPVSGQAAATLWLPNPDTPEGYGFYRTQVASLLRTYPQITQLVVWFRRDATPWTSLRTNDLPAAWQRSFAAEVQRTPAAAGYWHAPGLYAIGRIVHAFERAVRETGAAQTRVAAGTWSFTCLPAADRFFPPGVPLIPLDYEVIHEKPQLAREESRAPVREVGARRPVIPVVWAHHDDGHYIGRPYTPLPEFASKLADAKAAGFGIIHWTTRPLDLYFASLSKQVWQATRDEPLAQTCRDFAAGALGEVNRDTMGRYLEAWITGAPRFARETSDWFIDRPLTNIAAITAGSDQRQAILEQVRRETLTTEQLQRLEYQRGLERFIAAFHEAHGAFQESQDRLNLGDLEGARKAIQACHPEAVIELFARFSSASGITRGEQGLVVSLNTRWLSHIVRIKFAPTSHDKLAQSRGTFTFHFGSNGELWECWGQEETGAPVFALEDAVTVPAEESLPASWHEMARTGISAGAPLQLLLRPIMARDSRGKGKQALLPAGTYRLRLLVLAPGPKSAEEQVFDLSVAGAPAERIDVVQRAAGSQRLLEFTCPVALQEAGAVNVTITPVKGRAALCGVVLEPGS